MTIYQVPNVQSADTRWPLYSRSGRQLALRHATAGDVHLIVDLLLRLSMTSRLLRYFVPRSFTLDSAQLEANRMLSRANRPGTVLLVTTVEADEEVAIAVGELVIDQADPTRAEFAIIVRDSEQADGIGTLLAQALLARARNAGVSRLCADIMPGNIAVRQLIQRLCLPYDFTMDASEWQVALRLAA